MEVSQSRTEWFLFLRVIVRVMSAYRSFVGHISEVLTSTRTFRRVVHVVIYVKQIVTIFWCRLVQCISISVVVGWE
jgi:hypothetical protein